MKMIKIITISTLIACLSTSGIGQTNDILKKIDSLRYLRNQPFICNSDYWHVVTSGKDAIPLLIDKLDDTTATQISLICKRANVKFGDICYEALREIINIPLMHVTKIQFDWIDKYNCLEGVFTYLDENREQFKSQIHDCYNKYKANIKFVKYRKGYKNECKRKNKIFGYYDVDWKLLYNPNRG